MIAQDEIICIAKRCNLDPHDVSPSQIDATLTEVRAVLEIIDKDDRRILSNSTMVPRSKLDIYVRIESVIIACEYSPGVTWRYDRCSDIIFTNLSKHLFKHL